jgi:hypothetical protein
MAVKLCSMFWYHWVQVACRYLGKWSRFDDFAPGRLPGVTGVLTSAETTDKTRQDKTLELQFNSIQFSFVTGYLTAALRTRASGSFE